MIITIGFSRAKSKFALYGKAIQAIEKRPYSHAYTRYTDPRSGLEMVFQAAHGSVNLCNYDLFLEHSIVEKEYKLECTEDQFNDLWCFMMKMQGIKYGWLQAVGMFLNKLIHIENPFKDDLSTEVCSELAARVCSILKIPIPNDFDDITPSNLDTILGNNI